MPLCASQEAVEKTVGQLWEDCEKTMGNYGKTKGKLREKLWQNYETMRKLWGNYVKLWQPMKILWETMRNYRKTTKKPHEPMGDCVPNWQMANRDGREFVWRTDRRICISDLRCELAHVRCKRLSKPGSLPLWSLYMACLYGSFDSVRGLQC